MGNKNSAPAQPAYPEPEYIDGGPLFQKAMSVPQYQPRIS